MKILVIGGGSIGRRHLANLQRLGVSAALAEPQEPTRSELGRQLGIPVFSSMEEGLDWGPDAAVVATPSDLHVAQTLTVLSAGADVFVEKPLGVGPQDIGTLVEMAAGTISMVGCNMRFHPGPARVKELLDSGVLGQVMFARLHAGSFLPGWRPGRDYRTSYSASAAMGGGCILDYIHELDLCRWYRGEVSDVACIGGHLSTLQIDAEDVSALLVRHIDGTISEIHLDYVQRTYERGCQVVGENGSIWWDFADGTVRHYDASKDLEEVVHQPDGWEVNSMYLDEMVHFLSSVERRQPTVLPICEGAEVLGIALAAKASLRGRKFVSPKEALSW